MYYKWKIDTMKINKNGENFVKELPSKWTSINLFINKSFL